MTPPEIVYVRGGAREEFRVQVGDVVTIHDVEGGQACEVLAPALGFAQRSRVLDDAHEAGAAVALIAKADGDCSIFAVGAAATLRV